MSNETESSMSRSMASPPPPSSATALSISSSMEAALRSEIKRLRDEVIDLRREAARAKTLQSEVETLKAVTLMQSEEKVPLRLRELELENQRLKRQNRSLEEKLASVEGDMRYRDLLMSKGLPPAAESMQMQSPNMTGMMEASHSALEMSITNDAAWPSFTNTSMAMVPNNATFAGVGGMGSSVAPGRVLVLRHGQDPCVKCSARLGVAEKAFEAERIRLTKANKELQMKLDAANEEIRAVQAWVTPVVAALQQYPRMAETQPLSQLHSFASPTRTTGEAMHVGSQVLGATSSLHAPPNLDTPRQLWGGERSGPATGRTSYLDASRSPLYSGFGR